MKFFLNIIYNITYLIKIVKILFFFLIFYLFLENLKKSKILLKP